MFAPPVVEFIGPESSGDGIRPMSSKVKAIQDYPTPTTIKERQTFLDIVNYYHRFVPMADSKMASLYNVLAQKPKNLLWDTEQHTAFIKTKQVLVDAATLYYTLPSAPLILTTDASNLAISAVLDMSVDGVSQPLAF